jgi:hypothetical protein
MRDPTSFPLLTPELLLGSGPLPAPPPGPMRFMLEDSALATSPISTASFAAATGWRRRTCGRRRGTVR